MSTSGTALEGLLVLELSSVLAGPAVGQFLAELGAQVIKVENPRTRGDVTRHWKLATEAAHDDRPAYFCAVNWGKASLALDLTQASHRMVFHRLAARADVLIQNYKPGVAERFEADYPTLQALNPRLIYVDITAYGPEDPRPGFDAIIQAESGFTHLNGPADGGPTKLPVALMDLLTAHQAKQGILLALLQRTQHGQGTYLTVSLLRSAVSALANQATNWLVGGVVPQRQGSDHPNIVPYGTAFTAADGQPLVLAVGTERQFEALCDVLGVQWHTEPAFATNAARVVHRAALHAKLTEAFQAQPLDHWLQTLTEAGVPVGAVRAMDRVFDHPEAAAALLTHRRPDGHTEHGLRGVAFAFAGDHPGLPLTPPPSLHQDAETVLNRLDLPADVRRAILDQPVG
ncbi:MAG: CoA transferase [Bacteroidota bacterium]